MGDLYGHRQLIALRGPEGLLCHRWLASDVIGILLFVDGKSVQKWFKAIKKHGLELPTVMPHAISALPPTTKAMIQPSDDIVDLRRITSRLCWCNIPD